MNETKHTPGPWKPCRSWESFDGPYYGPDDAEDAARMAAQPFTSIQAAGGVNIAAAHDLFEFKDADARLIAAAPELLDALLHIRDHNNGLAAVTRALADKAIAKAEGRA